MVLNYIFFILTKGFEMRFMQTKGYGRYNGLGATLITEPISITNLSIAINTMESDLKQLDLLINTYNTKLYPSGAGTASVWQGVVDQYNKLDSKNAAYLSTLLSDLHSFVASVSKNRDTLMKGFIAIKDFYFNAVKPEYMMLLQQKADLESSVSSLNLQIQALQASISKTYTQAQYDALVVENTKIKNDLASALNELDANKTKILDYEIQIKNLNSQISSLRLDTTNQISALNLKINDMRLVVDDLTKKLAIKDSTITNLTNINTSLTANQANLNTQIKTLQSQIASLQSQITSYESKIISLQQGLAASTSQTQYDALKLQYDNVVISYRDLQSSYDAKMKELTSLTSANSSLITNQKALEAQIGSLQIQLKSMVDKITLYETKIVDLTNALSNGSISNAQYDALSKTYNATMIELNSLKTKYDSASKELDILRKEYALTQDKASSLQQSNTTLTSDNKSLSDKIIVLNTTIRSLNDQIATLQNSISIQESKIKALETKLGVCVSKDEYEKCQMLYNKTMNDYNALLIERNNCLQRADELSVKLQNLTQIQRDLSTSNDKLSSENRSLASERDLLKQQIQDGGLDRDGLISQYTQQLDSLRLESQNAIQDKNQCMASQDDNASMIQSLNDQIVGLQAQIEELQLQNQEIVNNTQSMTSQRLVTMAHIDSNTIDTPVLVNLKDAINADNSDNVKKFLEEADDMIVELEKAKALASTQTSTPIASTPPSDTQDSKANKQEDASNFWKYLSFGLGASILAYGGYSIYKKK